MENKEANEEIIGDIVNKRNVNANAIDSLTKEERNMEEINTKDTMPTDFENATNDLTSSEGIEQSNNDSITFIDDIADDLLRSNEESMTEIDKEECKRNVLLLKDEGNGKFMSENYIESINLYTKALNICPFCYKTERSILYCNRAAAKLKLNYNETAIEDCTKAIELDSKYLKAYLRRAKLYEKTDKLDESLKDFTRILELDSSNAEAKAASVRLPPIINEKNEKLKEEMLGKLKDLGNLVLRPFGLSTDNFKLQQDPNTGGYSVNFQQNRNN